MKLYSGFNYLKQINRHKKALLLRSINIAFSMLSIMQKKAKQGGDIQEDINDVKRVLLGSFKEINPFACEVIKKVN